MEIPIVKNKQCMHFGGGKKCMRNHLKPMYYMHSIIHCLYAQNDVIMMILLNDMQKRQIKNVKLKQILVHALFLTILRDNQMYSKYYNILSKMDNTKVVNAREAYIMLCEIHSNLILRKCNQDCKCRLHKSEMQTINITKLQRNIDSRRTYIPYTTISEKKVFIDYCLEHFNNDFKAFILNRETIRQFKISKSSCNEIFHTCVNMYTTTKNIDFLYDCMACVFFTKTYMNQVTSNITRYNIFRGFIDCILEFPEYNSEHFDILNSICMLAKFSLKFYNISLVYYIMIHAVANTFMKKDIIKSLTIT